MWKIGWGVSNKCNMKCDFCYSKKVREEDSKLFINEGLDFILHNKDKIESINFGTGEPTLEREFFSLCKRIKNINSSIRIGVTTNGNLATMIKNKCNLEYFIDSIDEVDISVDYYTQELQDRSRNYSGAYQGVINTLEACQKHNKLVTIVTVLHKYNGTIENLNGIIRLARLYGASFRINILRPTVNNKYIIAYDDLKRGIITIVNKYTIQSIADPLFAYLLGLECLAGDPTARSSFRILPNGYITPSTYLLDNKWQTIHVSDITDINELAEDKSFKDIIDIQVPDSCKNCSGQDNCKGGVIDRRWLWYKNLQESDPYCPMRYSDDISCWRNETKTITLAKEERASVHDGYLPTLIFDPAVNPNAHNRWDTIFIENQDQYNGEEEAGLVRLFLQSYLIKEKANIVDFGSGNGRNAIPFLKKKHFVTCVDSSILANDLLQKRLLENEIYDGYSIHDSDIQEFCVTNKKSYSVVLLLHVLSHGTHNEIKALLASVTDLLDEEGFLLLTLPSICDARYRNHQHEKSFQLESGPEKGIVHSFFDWTDILVLVGKDNVLYMEEVADSKNESVHWNLIVRKCIEKSNTKEP